MSTSQVVGPVGLNTHTRFKTTPGWLLVQIGVFLAPWIGITVIPGRGFTVSDVFLLIGGITILAASFGSSMASLRAVPRTRVAGIVYPGFVIVLAVSLSAMLNGEATLHKVFVSIGQHSLSFLFLPLVLGCLSRDQIERLLRVFSIGLCASVVCGLFLIVFVPPLAARLVSAGYMFAFSTGRQGLFSGAGELSKMSAMCVPVVYLLMVRRRLSSAFAGILFAVLFMASIIARSGLGFIALILAVTVTAILAKRRPQGGAMRTQGKAEKSPKTLIVGVLALVGFALAIKILASMGIEFGLKFFDRVIRPASVSGIESVGSGQERLALVNEALRFIAARPFAGMGPGVAARVSEFGTDVHVVPLQMWVQMGILGLLGWLWFMACLLGRFWRRTEERSRSSAVAWGVFAAFLVTNFSMPFVYERGLLLPALLMYFFVRARDANGCVSRSNRAAAVM